MNEMAPFAMSRQAIGLGMDFYERMKRYSLSDAQLAQCIENGVISPKVEYLITKPEKGEFIPANASDDYLAVCGVKLAFTLDDRGFRDRYCSYVSFFITEFHMLVYKSPGFDSKYLRKDFSYLRSSQPATFYAVPLESIRRVELVTGEERISFSDAVTVETSKGDPVLGSAIGAGLFGAAGAVGGALANSGTNTRVVVPALLHLYQDFGLKLYMNDDKDADSRIDLCPLFKIDNAVGTNERSFNKSINAQLLGKFTDVPQHCCDELNRLISKAKETENDEDRVAVIRPQIKQAEAKAQKDSVLGAIFAALLLGGLIYFWINF